MIMSAAALLVIIALFGVYLDSLVAVSALNLHQIFLVTSIVTAAGVLTGYYNCKASYPERIIVCIATVIVWRISFFPLLVLAGCITSWANAATNALSISAVVYPVFLVSFALLFAGAVWWAIHVLRTKRLIASVAAVCLATLATIVSFIAPADFKWPLLRSSTNLTLAAPIVAPGMNPYPLILSKAQLNWRQQLLMRIGSLTYQSLPERGAPWALSVKGSLEHLLRNASGYRSELFLVDHYRAFSAAHPKLR